VPSLRSVFTLRRSFDAAIADAREESSVVSSGDDSSAHRSPVKVPSKPALFSFASVQSPFSKDFTKNFNFAEFASEYKMQTRAFLKVLAELR